MVYSFAWCSQGGSGAAFPWEIDCGVFGSTHSEGGIGFPCSLRMRLLEARSRAEIKWAHKRLENALDAAAEDVLCQVRMA